VKLKVYAPRIFKSPSPFTLSQNPNTQNTRFLTLFWISLRTITRWQLSSRHRSPAANSRIHQQTVSRTFDSPITAISYSSPRGTRYALTNQVTPNLQILLNNSISDFFLFIYCRLWDYTTPVLMLWEESFCTVVPCLIAASTTIPLGSVPAATIPCDG
jgi:hypothetical protein